MCNNKTNVYIICITELHIKLCQKQLRIFGRTRQRWEDNIKMYLEQINWESADFRLAQNRKKWRAVVMTAVESAYLHCASIVSKRFFIVPTDAHY